VFYDLLVFFSCIIIKIINNKNGIGNQSLALYLSKFQSFFKCWTCLEWDSDCVGDKFALGGAELGIICKMPIMASIQVTYVLDMPEM
jgi:hypothetical protein